MIYRPVVINSQEYNLKFARLNLYLSDSNTDKYTNLDRNETKLKEGEIFAFNIKNTSIYDNGNVSCSVSVYAVNKLNYEEKELLYSRDNIAVGYGEISDTISFNSWNVKLSGTYDIIAEINGNCGFDTLMLGTLSVKEQQSSIVTASDDIVDDLMVKYHSEKQWYMLRTLMKLWHLVLRTIKHCIFEWAN